MAAHHSLDGTRIFARISAVDFECPGCGAVHILRPVSSRKTGWNPRAGLFRCDCGTAYAFGLLIYPVVGAAPRQIAADWVPSARQGAALRQLTSNTGIYLADAQRQQKHHPRNRTATCTCYLEPRIRPGEEIPDYHPIVNPKCPVHRGGQATSLPRVAAAGDAAEPPPPQAAPTPGPGTRTTRQESRTSSNQPKAQRPGEVGNRFGARLHEPPAVPKYWPDGSGEPEPEP